MSGACNHLSTMTSRAKATPLTNSARTPIRFLEGADAFDSGIVRTANPYAKGTRARRAWLAGYTDAWRCEP